MRTRIYLWVTSNCTLACPNCSQKYTMSSNVGYEMPIEEVRFIVDSCKSRGIHFEVIELTGGEASLWSCIREGIELLQGICDEITLVTNGNNPDLILSLPLPYFIVSASQANKAQMMRYSQSDKRILYNTHKHRKLPEFPLQNVLPAQCCTTKDSFGCSQVTMEYIRGKVYYCCDAFAHTEYTGEYEEIVCDFEEDFISKFSNKSYNLDICQYCLCNQKVWNRL